MRKIACVLSIALACVASSASAQQRAQEREPPIDLTQDSDGWRAAPARKAGEGAGPFRKLVIRGVTLIDGTGAPPRGPFDIVIEGNTIKDILRAGTPGLPMKPGREPRDADHEIEAGGMYAMPGFIDMHVHGSSTDKASDLGYAYKLWLAHGITTVRGVPFAPLAVTNSEKARSARNEIAAPRIFHYEILGWGWSGGMVRTPQQAREWVRWAAKNGIDGIKFMNGYLNSSETPEVIAAAIDEAHKHKMGTVAHLAQTGVANFNARQAGAAHLDTVTHFYGHFESLLKAGAVQKYSTDYDFNDEQYRFGEVADIWDEIHEPGSSQWQEYLEHQKAHHVTFDPTMTIYAASRDLMRARTADFHDKYTMPQLWDYFQSSRQTHGSYFFDWTTRREIQWRRFYGRFMALVNDYKNIGGRVTTGTDSGFIFKIYGFSFPEEMELLQEAGFHPLEVVRAATMNGALTLYEPKGIADPPLGVVRIGKLADLVIVKENPLQNFKTLYGNGTPRLNEETQQLERVGGVSYTIKDGIVYDARKLLADVAEMVAAEKQRLRQSEQLPRPLEPTAPDSATQPGAALTSLADALLGHLETTNVNVRMRRHLPLDRLPDLSAEGASREAHFNRQMLERLERIPSASLSHEQQLLAGALRHSFQAGSSADQDYWFRFAVTPYSGVWGVQAIHQALAATPLASAADRDRFLKVLDDYVTVVKTMREKTLAQAQRGIRVPRPALPGVLATLKGLRSSAQATLEAAAARGTESAGTTGPSFETRVQERAANGVLPAYDALILVLDQNYEKQAPSQVGVGTYAGGKDYYRRQAFAETGLDLTPQAIHELGLRRVAELAAQLAKIRADVGFKGDRNAFHTFLQTDPRFLASSPADVEARYSRHMERVTRVLPQYFSVLPQAPYGLQRLHPAAEPGMTYGYYNAPTPAEPRGLYYYNGSNLSQRSLVISAHLIYHELLPGHHLQVALASENESLHPVVEFLSIGAYAEGWAEYAAELTVEMGALQDPYDRYGHLLAQTFTASRLVVDTGMNSLGWSLEQARQFMREHCFLSETEIATETLRYSTDIPAQALGYRLGYEAIMDGRKRAERALGDRFDIRVFNTAVSSSGDMPLNVLQQQVDRFIAQTAR